MNKTKIQEYIQHVNAEMHSKLLDVYTTPTELYDPVKYILSNGGKRIRAVMTMVASSIFSEDQTQTIAAAIGLEVFHNFTLLHDDIMDKALIRRGNPTVHIKWDENTAILSGDAMMVLANIMISKTPSSVLLPVFTTFNKTAIEVCEGQQLDMNLERRDLNTQITEDEYLEMIRLKTSVLIGASLKIGALCGGATIEQADALYNYGIQIGLAFQIQDDLLDTYGNEAEFGKRIGGDILEGKKTYLLIKAFERASAEDKQLLIENCKKTGISADKKIALIKDIYTRTDIQKISQQKIDSYFEKASDYLHKLNIDPSKLSTLVELEHMLSKRNK